MSNVEENPDLINQEMEDRKLWFFYEKFCVTASLQGRLAYLLMSIHAVNPSVLHHFTSRDPSQVLFVNMVYGVGVMLYSRPSMIAISSFHRLVFSVLGSLMFNHSTMLFYGWLVENWKEKPLLLTFMGILGGRIMMLHLLAYLYHVDSRYRGFHVRTFSDFESMYR